MAVTLDLSVAELSEMTAREYAVNLGLAKPTRGRMSPAAYEAISKAEKRGVTFKLSASKLAEIARKDQPLSKRVMSDSHKAALAAGRARAAAEKSGVITMPEKHERGQMHSQEWYEKTFKDGAFVCNPAGITFKVVSDNVDKNGFTHLIDKAGKKCKAKVNASWGVRKGWPEKKNYVPNNDA